MSLLLDLLIVAALALGGYLGVRRGFVVTLYELVAWIVAIIAAIALQASLAARLEALFGWPAPFAGTVALVSVLVAAEIVFSVGGRVLLAPLTGSIARDRVLARLDRALGAVPALARTLLIIAVALVATLTLPIPQPVRAAVDASALSRTILEGVATVQPRLRELATAPDDGSAPFVTRLGADESQTLNVPADLALEADPEAEQQMLALVNDERTSRGLAALVADERLVRVARAHSEDMFRARYFSHVSPTTGKLGDRLAAAKVTYTRAGENLAYTRSVAVAHRGLMDSPGHRENILHPDYTRIGIGVVSAGPYGRMFTQLFLSP